MPYIAVKNKDAEWTVEQFLYQIAAGYQLQDFSFHKSNFALQLFLQKVALFFRIALGDILLLVGNDFLKQIVIPHMK